MGIYQDLNQDGNKEVYEVGSSQIEYSSTGTSMTLLKHDLKGKVKEWKPIGWETFQMIFFKKLQYIVITCDGRSKKRKLRVFTESGIFVREIAYGNPSEEVYYSSSLHALDDEVLLICTKQGGFHNFSDVISVSLRTNEWKEIFKYEDVIGKKFSFAGGRNRLSVCVMDNDQFYIIIATEEGEVKRRTSKTSIMKYHRNNWKRSKVINMKGRNIFLKDTSPYIASRKYKDCVYFFWYTSQMEGGYRIGFHQVRSVFNFVRFNVETGEVETSFPLNFSAIEESKGELIERLHATDFRVIGKKEDIVVFGGRIMGDNRYRCNVWFLNTVRKEIFKRVVFSEVAFHSIKIIKDRLAMISFHSNGNSPSYLVGFDCRESKQVCKVKLMKIKRQGNFELIRSSIDNYDNTTKKTKNKNNKKRKKRKNKKSQPMSTFVMVFIPINAFNWKLPQIKPTLGFVTVNGLGFLDRNDEFWEKDFKERIRWLVSDYVSMDEITTSLSVKIQFLNMKSIVLFRFFLVL